MHGKLGKKKRCCFMELTAYCMCLSGRDDFEITLSSKYPCVPLTKGTYGKQLLKVESCILIHPILLRVLINLAKGLVLFPYLLAAVPALDRTGT